MTITKIADDRTPGSGGQTAASATITTTAATTTGPVIHAPLLWRNSFFYWLLPNPALLYCVSPRL